MATRSIARCSFCGKRRDQVRALVAGPGVFICDQCVALCNEIISQDPPPAPNPAEPPPTVVEPGGARWVARVFRRGWRGRPPTGWSGSRPAS